MRNKERGKIFAVLLAVMLIVSCIPAGIAFGGTAPTISPHGGTITTSTRVGIDATLSVGQAVYYTITPGSSGTMPTVSSSVYSIPFIVSPSPGTFTVEAAVCQRHLNFDPFWHLNFDPPLSLRN